MKRIILLGPIFFAITLVTLTIIQYDFMRGLGWHPLNDPTFDWPSGLALVQYGIVMTATFIISGLLIAVLAIRLKADRESDITSQAGSASAFGLVRSSSCLPCIHHRSYHSLHSGNLAWTYTRSVVCFAWADLVSIHDNPWFFVSTK